MTGEAATQSPRAVTTESHVFQRNVRCVTPGVTPLRSPGGRIDFRDTITALAAK
jgi:hypothetical protein